MKDNEYFLVVHQLMRDGLETGEPTYSIMSAKDIKEYYDIQKINFGSYICEEFCKIERQDKYFLTTECGIPIQRLAEFEVQLQIVKKEYIEIFLGNKLARNRAIFERLKGIASKFKDELWIKII